MPDDVIEFVIPYALPSLNVRDRQHWAKRGRDKSDLSMEVLAAIGGPRHKPFPPWSRVRVTVVRASSGKLDRDNLYASCKSLCDVLCVRSPRHPTGLGICIDDNEAAMDLKVSQTSASPGAGSTLVRVERLV